MGQLLTLPVRLSARAATIALRGTESVALRAVSVAGRVAQVVGVAQRERREPAPSRDDPRPAGESRAAAPTSAPEAAPAPAPEAAPASAPEAAPASAAVPALAESRAAQPDSPASEPEAAAAEPAPAAASVEPAPAPEPEPVHVSEEPTLVRESAEPGAEDGAGAQVTVDEPWDGYGQLGAQDVIERLSVATAAELAAVSLYESTHQSRQTVLSAAERQLQLASRGGASQ